MPNILVKYRTAAALTIAAVASATASSAWAASLQVSPINLFVTTPSKAGAVSLSNQSKEPVRLQIRLYRWRQKDGEEILEPTRDVIANPPSMEIPPQQTYTIRVARLSAAPIGPEESYRLIIDELPSPIDPASANNGVKMLLRTSLPVFFGAKLAAPKIAWRVWNENGKLTLEAANSGDRHIKLVGLTVSNPQGETKFNAAGSNAYVLPGSTMRYTPISTGPPHAPGTPVTITTAKGTLFEVNQQITVTAAP